jgi:hypothetical protein
VLSEGIGVTSSANLKTNSLDIMNKHIKKSHCQKYNTVNRKKGLLLKTKDLHTNTDRTKAEKNYRPYNKFPRIHHKNG